VKTIAASDEVARQLLRHSVLFKSDSRLAAVKSVDLYARGFENDLPVGCQARRNQILDHFVLGINHHALAASQFTKIDAVPTATEAQLNAAMKKALAMQAFANPSLGQQIDSSLLQNSGANARLDVLAARRFEDYGLYALQMQKVREHQTGWACSNDSDLGAPFQARLFLADNNNAKLAKMEI
jgi:hypothetical protein